MCRLGNSEEGKAPSRTYSIWDSVFVKTQIELISNMFLHFKSFCSTEETSLSLNASSGRFAYAKSNGLSTKYC